MTNIKLFYIWVAFFPARLFFMFLISFLYFPIDRIYANLFYKTTTAILLFFIGINFLKAIIYNQEKYYLMDKIIISCGLIMMVGKTIQLDLPGVIIAFMIFILPQLLREINWQVCKNWSFLLALLGLIISIEYFLEMVAMNSHILGMEKLWYFSNAEYLNFGMRFNPLKNMIHSHRSLGFVFRADGIFGFYFSTASYLALSGGFLLIFALVSKKYWYAPIAIMIFIPVFITLSSTINLAFISGLILFFFIDRGVNWKQKIIIFGLFWGAYNLYILNFNHLGINPIQWMILKTKVNLQDESYVYTFLPILKNNNVGEAILQMITSFKRWNSISAESDVFNIIFAFGFIPSAMLVVYYGNAVLRVLWSKVVTQESAIAKASSSAVLIGSLLLIHSQMVLSWAVGALYFLFLSSILNYYTLHLRSQQISRMPQFSLFFKKLRKLYRTFPTLLII